jgi:hypothetical protein
VISQEYACQSLRTNVPSLLLPQVFPPRKGVGSSAGGGAQWWCRYRRFAPPRDRMRAPLTDAGLHGLTEEQAALRRVATLVARGVPARDLFRAVTEEVGRVLSADYVHLIRYEPDDTATALAAFGTGGTLPAGTRLKLGGKNATTLA